MPSGIPIYLVPLVSFIEVLSFLSRPLSHSVRLFGNILAGHITVQVFAGFIVTLGAAWGALGWIGAILPFSMTVALIALDLLVAFSRPTCSQSSPASTFTMRSIPAIDARQVVVSIEPPCR